ncbi:hypothetical protein GCM10022202_15880 [Microbacterium marinilacus]|uniref:Uncharacterized protein n=1 Tax=Microbacterium marinilacus TaxID=415209 RepID=A0ABP7BE91_9MICO
MLADDEVRHILIERNAEMGATGGAVGGGAAGGRAGAAGGASGGRIGGRLGARLFTRVTGLTRTYDVPRTGAAAADVRGILQPLPASSDDDDAIVGLIGAGALGMNSAVVQVVWHADRVEATAHALEGLIDQRTAAGALLKVEDALARHRPGGDSPTR